MRAGGDVLARGFTLIEMGIVLVVIGLLFSGGLAALSPVVQNTKISETKAKLDRVEQALILHVIRHGCLPCPATAGTASTVATAGQAENGAYSSGCQAAACTIAQGVVPWVNLELTENDASDSFGTRFSYAITSSTAAPNNLQATSGMVRVPPSTYPAGNLVVNTTAAGPIQITNVAAYVLISHGQDRARGFRAQTGAQVPADAGASATQLDNSNGTPFVQDDNLLASPATYFDDIVRWRSAPFIIQLCGTNACGNPA